MQTWTVLKHHYEMLILVTYLAQYLVKMDIPNYNLISKAVLTHLKDDQI